MRHVGFVVTVTTGSAGTTGTMVGVVGGVVVSVVGTIPMVVVVVVERVAAPIGRVPAPIVPIAIAVTIIIGVIAVAVAIVVWIVPAAKHIGNIARLHPHLVTHNHNGIERGVVGERQEVCVAIAVVPIGRGHTIGERGETLQTTRIGTAVVVYVEVVVGAHSAATCHNRACGACHHIIVTQNIVNVGTRICCGNHCCDASFVLCPCGSFLLGEQSLCLFQGGDVVCAVEVVNIGGGVARGEP